MISVAVRLAGYTQPVVFTGDLVPKQPWQANQDVINLTTGLKWLPMRVLEVRDIVSINGVDAAMSKLIPSHKSYQVAGSKGNFYTVTDTNGHLTCDCVGFGFHGRCKHLSFAK